MGGRIVRGRGRQSFALALLALSLLLPLLAGCGESDTIAGSTPQATAEAFVEAMQAGEYEKVAKGFDYETYARRENPDWDSIPQSQRNLIVEKLQEDRAGQLQAMAGMMTGEVTVGEVQQQGDTATVNILAGANSVVLGMREIDGEWLVATMAEIT